MLRARTFAVLVPSMIHRAAFSLRAFLAFSLVFGFLLVWPFAERRVTGDYGYHNVLDRPRDAPWRTAIGFAVLTWVFMIFLAGSADRIDVLFDLPYTAQIFVYRILIWIAPVVVGAIAYRVCTELQAGERVERDRGRARREAEFS